MHSSAVSDIASPAVLVWKTACREFAMGASALWRMPRRIRVQIDPRP